MDTTSARPARPARRTGALRLTRRQLLPTLGLALAMPGLPAASAPAQTAGRPLRVAQLLDMSADQQELSRDYATGLRLALAEQARSGRPALQLATLETDGSAADLDRVLRSLKADTSAVALLGTAGERLVLASIAAAQTQGLEIAHLAPWLADTRHDRNEAVFPLFASRELQIRQAVQSLASVGVGEIGLVYASAALDQALHAGVQQGARALGLKTSRYLPAARQDLAALGAAFPANSPALLLFLGGSIELALFTQGLARRGLQRYVVCLSDVDVGTLMQLAPGARVPLIFTQVVPNPQASPLPVVRAYRTLLKTLYDEAPSPLSLAGYLAGRYAVAALAPLDGSATRATVLAQLQRRPTVDLGGVQIRFSEGRGSSYVNQTMLSASGKLIG